MNYLVSARMTHQTVVQTGCTRRRIDTVVHYGNIVFKTEHGVTEEHLSEIQEALIKLWRDADNTIVNEVTCVILAISPII